MFPKSCISRTPRCNIFIDDVIVLDDVIVCRLDFYFSSNTFAKPLLLLSLTFVIIICSSVVLMLVQVYSLPAAAPSAAFP